VLKAFRSFIVRLEKRNSCRSRKLKYLTDLKVSWTCWLASNQIGAPRGSTKSADLLTRPSRNKILTNSLKKNKQKTFPNKPWDYFGHWVRLCKFSSFLPNQSIEFVHLFYHRFLIFFIFFQIPFDNLSTWQLSLYPSLLPLLLSSNSFQKSLNASLFISMSKIRKTIEREEKTKKTTKQKKAFLVYFLIGYRFSPK